MSTTCALFLAFAAGAGAQDGAYERALAALAEGRPDEAWRELEAEPDPILRSRGRAAAFANAGDPSGELRAAEEGLEHDPEHQELLFYAAQAALWLRDDRRAERYVERLARSLERHPPVPEARAEWEDVVRNYRKSAAELATAREVREATARRAHRFSLGVLGAVLLGLVLLAVRAGPRVPYGTPAP